MCLALCLAWCVAMSLAMWLKGAIDTEKFVSYVVAQLAGAASAYGVARAVF
jgi:glycerol uptake facilitator-like aquaporin